MSNDLQVNADRFTGFADIYDNARPQPPNKAKEIILKYLKTFPELIIDLGSGTGLSTFIWSDVARAVIGIEPSVDMINIANEKAKLYNNVSFKTGYSDNTGLDNESVDIVTCSQSFHWMNPETTINEVSRILKKQGIFAVYDCDWPPVFDWELEREYNNLFAKVKELESNKPELRNTFKSWSKENHLSNLHKSAKFQYVREIVFSNNEKCDAENLRGIMVIPKSITIYFQTR